MSATAASAYAADLATIRAARRRIEPFVHRTPVATSATLDALSGRALHFKCELLQKTGSFKFRGATNAVRLLDDAQAVHGVVTHSSGNHAQALALAALAEDDDPVTYELEDCKETRGSERSARSPSFGSRSPT